jgi:hypothetical protein
MSMKTRNFKRPAVKGRRRVMILVAVAVIVVAAAITVISRQNSAAKSAAPTVTKAATAAATSAGPTYVTRRIGGQDIQIDTQTGQIKPLTAQEAQKLAEGLAPMVDRSSDGLTAVRQGDGSVSMDLQGHFQSVAVARVTTEGMVEQSCVDNPEAAGKFFGIDPRLIREAQAAQKRTRQIQAPN